MTAIPIYYDKKKSKISPSRTKKAYDLETCYVAFGLRAIIVCSIDDPRLTLINFTAMSNVVFLEFIRGNLVESYLIGKKNLQQMI